MATKHKSAPSAPKTHSPDAEEHQVPQAEAEAPLREDGPTLEEFVAAGYLAENYPPQGYKARTADEPAKQPEKAPSIFTHPDAVELDSADRDTIDKLTQQKVAMGLPTDQARVSAERQVREDKSGLYAKVRSHLEPARKPAK